MNIDDMCVALPHLSPAELKTVHARVSMLLHLEPKAQASTVAGEEPFARDLYNAIADLLAKRTKVKRAPFAVFCKQSAYSEHFLPAAKAAEEANAQWFAEQTKAERMSMLMLYARLVLDHLAARSKPAVWALISYTLTDLPEIVDAAFPGYAEAGLLGKVHSIRTKGMKV